MKIYHLFYTYYSNSPNVLGTSNKPYILYGFYWCICMLCMYICAISCWQWTVKWLLHTLLSTWVWISELNLAYCRGNVLIHWQKCVIYTNDCWLLSRAGAVVVLAPVLSRCWCGGQQQHLRSTETLAGGKERPGNTETVFIPKEEKRFYHGFFHYYYYFSSEISHERKS